MGRGIEGREGVRGRGERWKGEGRGEGRGEGKRGKRWRGEGRGEGKRGKRWRG